VQLLERLVVLGLVLVGELLESVLVAMGRLPQSPFAVQRVTVFEKFVEEDEPGRRCVVGCGDPRGLLTVCLVCRKPWPTWLAPTWPPSSGSIAPLGCFCIRWLYPEVAFR
jgi:hypothetical protein